MLILGKRVTHALTNLGCSALAGEAGTPSQRHELMGGEGDSGRGGAAAMAEISVAAS